MQNAIYAKEQKGQLLNSMEKANAINKSTLYLVPTPIGNLLDITLRAVEVLKEVDYIFAEDTRVTKVLLSHFNISTKLKTYHSFNEDTAAEEIIKLLEEENSIAIVTDAGMPGISDPGYYIVSKALENNYGVISLPGANAALTALVASGIVTNRFYFYGFLKHKDSQKEKELEELVDFKDTLIFYESPHRLKSTISLLYKIFGNRKIAIAREITKKFEEYIRSDLETLVNQELTIKGEFVIIVEGASSLKITEELTKKTVEEHYNYYLDEGYNNKEALKMVTKDRKVAKNEIYKVINK